MKNQLNLEKYTHGNEIITTPNLKVIKDLSRRLVWLPVEIVQPTLQATSKLSLAGRFGPFCKYDMMTNRTVNPQNGDPVLPVILLFSL